MISPLATMGTPMIAITGQPQSTLGRAARVTLDLGPVREACTLGLAPSTSTTLMLAIGDALALVVSRMRQFGPEDFARFHPGGSLGRKLAKVEDVMRPLCECRVAEESQTVRGVLVCVSRPGRRTGAIMLVDDSGHLAGLFTDSDLVRMLEQNEQSALDGSIQQVMTRQPTTVLHGTPLTQAIELLVRRKISELPVVDDQGMPIGLIDITDVLAQEEIHQAAQTSPRSAQPKESAGWRLKTLRFPKP